jgi:hypothetical protein
MFRYPNLPPLLTDAKENLVPVQLQVIKTSTGLGRLFSPLVVRILLGIDATGTGGIALVPSTHGG